MTPISKAWKLLDFYGSLLLMAHYNLPSTLKDTEKTKNKKKTVIHVTNVEFVHDPYTKIKRTKLALEDASTHISEVEEIVVVFDNNIFF